VFQRAFFNIGIVGDWSVLCDWDVIDFVQVDVRLTALFEELEARLIVRHASEFPRCLPVQRPDIVPVRRELPQYLQVAVDLRDRSLRGFRIQFTELVEFLPPFCELLVLIIRGWFCPVVNLFVLVPGMIPELSVPIDLFERSRGYRVGWVRSVPVRFIEWH
jgi:hypothetical protein